MATSRPNWVSFRPSWVLIGMPSTANIIQMAKQIVKAKVLLARTENGLLSVPM